MRGKCHQVAPGRTRSVHKLIYEGGLGRTFAAGVDLPSSLGDLHGSCLTGRGIPTGNGWPRSPTFPPNRRRSN